jgi:1-deoxy-D-xylulose-5-phosphate reductoisomerase
MESSPRKIVLLGATGTIGLRACEIMEESPVEWEVIAASAHNKRPLPPTITEKAKELFFTEDSNDHTRLIELLRKGQYDICLNGIVGAAGLIFSQAVLEAGKDLALANKESLVIAGSLLTSLAKKNKAKIIPVDSEHSAIFQCVEDRNSEIKKIFLTASGGSLRDIPIEKLSQVTPEEALNHPNWKMGKRITIDSSTMMNKVFEVIEAHWLFETQVTDIEILIHEQSIIHSMVELCDGSILAQMGIPDMGQPIHFALHYPKRTSSSFEGFDMSAFKELSLKEPSVKRYPSLEFAADVIKRGGNAGAVLNAADEIAVAAFLEGKISFERIYQICKMALENCSNKKAHSIEELLEADKETREYCLANIT